MTILKALKILYEELGGDPTAVADARRAVTVVNAIAALYGGDNDATKVSVAIKNIADVASGIVKPSGTKTITENGEGIDVAEYATVDVNVTPVADPET